MLGGHGAARVDKDHAEPNQHGQPVFEERFHPQIRRLKSARNAKHPTSNTERPMAESYTESQF